MTNKSFIQGKHAIELTTKINFLIDLASGLKESVKSVNCPMCLAERMPHLGSVVFRDIYLNLFKFI